MNPNPYKSPEIAHNGKNTRSAISLGVASVMLWSNVGLVIAYLFFSGMDWLYVNWGSRDTRDVHVAWSKLLFILIGANLIIFFTYINRNTGGPRNDSAEESAHEKRQQ